MKKKEKIFKKLNIQAKIIDISCGMDDDQLNKLGIYNDDIADFLCE